MKIKQFVLFDNYDNSSEYLVILKKETEKDDIQNIVYKTKLENEGTWTYEDILNAIKENFEVSEILDITYNNLIFM